MRTPKSMAGIFHDLQANRTDKANEDKKFVVLSLTWQGTPTRMDATALRYNGTVTMADAEERKAAMERLNPRRRYAIITL